MVDVPASAARRLVDSASGPSSASRRAPISMRAGRILGSICRGLTLTVLHNAAIVSSTTSLCYETRRGGVRDAHDSRATSVDRDPGAVAGPRRGAAGAGRHAPPGVPAPWALLPPAPGDRAARRLRHPVP